LIFSLTFLNLACQTDKVVKTPAKSQEVLETQKTLARSHLDAGKPDAALQLLRSMQRDHPDDPTVQNLLGLTHLAMRNAPRAARHFAKAYKLDKSPGMALNLSSAYIESGDFEKSTRLLLAMIKTKEFQAYLHKERAYHNLGYSFERLSQNSKAEEWYQEALDENPAFFPSHLELARLYERTGRPAMAAQSYLRANDHCHVCFEPVYALTMLYVKMNRPTDARKILVRFGKTDGIAAADRQKAKELLNMVTTAGLPRRHGG
jgi:Tfp pilus assembly protein PilF